MPVRGKALGLKPRLECIEELPPAGLLATGSVGTALRHTLVCCISLFFSSTNGNTGWICSLIAHRLKKKNQTPKYLVCVCVCVLWTCLMLETGAGTPSRSQQALAPRPALAQLSPCQRHSAGGGVGGCTPAKSILLVPPDTSLLG